MSEIDPGLFLKFDKEGELNGFLVTHVDDFLHAGDESFQKEVVENLQQIFLMGKTEESKFKYVGMDIEQTEEGITLSQQEYADSLEPITIKPERSKQTEENLSEDEKSTLRKIAGRLGWLAKGTRPDLAFSQVEISTKFLNGKVKDLIKAVKAYKKVGDTDSVYTIKNLGPVSDWTIEVNTDASLSNLNEAQEAT